MCMVTTLGLTGWAAITAVALETAAASAALSAGTSAAMGGEGGDIWKAAGIGGAMGLVGGFAGGAGALAGGTMAASGASGGTAGATAGATTGATTGAATAGAGSSLAPEAVGAIMGGISGATGGLSTVAQGQQAINDAENQKLMMDQQARNEEVKAAHSQEAAEIEKMDQRRKAHMLQGKGRAIGAANGVMLEASREEALVNVWEEDVAMETAYDNAKIQHNADLEQWGFRENARQMRLQGKLAIKSAKRQNRAGVLMGLGTSAIGGFGSGFSVGYQAAKEAADMSLKLKAAGLSRIPNYKYTLPTMPAPLK